MSKLFKLKQWLTIQDTASYLSSIFDEPVKDYDILRFALDGHLKLSANLVNHACARMCKVVSHEKVRKVPSLDGTFLIAMGIYLGDGNFLERENGITSVDGVMDLMMIGNEKLDIEHEYQQLTSGVELTLVCLEGVYLKNYENGNIYELQDCFNYDVKGMKDDNNYYPAGGLPKDAALVVRTSAIAEFIELVTDRKIEKPLIDKERQTLLVIIAALAKEAKVNISKVSKSGELIANLTQIIGAPIGATTIETHLKQIPEALQSRTK